MTEYQEFPDYGLDPGFVGYGEHTGCTCLNHMGRLQYCTQHPTRMGRTKDLTEMNETRAQAGLPPLAPGLQPMSMLTTRPLELEPRVIEAEPMVLRATRPPAPEPSVTLAPGPTLLAATILIPNQPTTEQWQIIKQAILDLHNAA